MTVTLTVKKEKLHQYIDEMDEYMIDLTISFLETLLEPDD